MEQQMQTAKRLVDSRVYNQIPKTEAQTLLTFLLVDGILHISHGKYSLPLGSVDPGDSLVNLGVNGTIETR